MSSLIFIRLYASRLHDLGRSGWWQLAFYGAEALVMVLVALAGQPMEVAIGAASLTHLAFIFVLGVIPGDRGANRFGPPPGQPSPLASAEDFR